jgi:hypothetical protein
MYGWKYPSYRLQYFKLFHCYLKRCGGMSEMESRGLVVHGLHTISQRTKLSFAASRVCFCQRRRQHDNVRRCSDSPTFSRYPISEKEKVCVLGHATRGSDISTF